MILNELLSEPDRGISRELLNQSVCVSVFPSVKKAAFIVGSSYSRGVISCRTGANLNGSWSAPAMLALDGGSFGLQAGGQATDFVLLVMNDEGARSILEGKVKLGANASIAAGPVGRNTSGETDAAMKAEILSWSRGRGVFAGIDLSGSTIRSDASADKELYGKDLTATQILRDGAVQPPAAAQSLAALLNRVSPKRKGY